MLLFVYINYLIILILFLSMSFYIIIIPNNNTYKYISLIKQLKKKLFHFVRNYENCYNYSLTPLSCGHKYEGYKVQKKGKFPQNVLVNLSVCKNIKTIFHTKCLSNKLIIGIVCAPNHYLERLAFRTGYANYNNVTVLFFTGLSDDFNINELLKSESFYHKDIVIFNFVSHYFNSSLMLSLELKWINTNCIEYKYFIYHTADVFFNFHLFYKKYIQSDVVFPLLGQILKKNRVLRSNRSRFYVPYEIYNKSHYPPQPNGPLVAFSSKTIEKMVKRVCKVKMSFWMDDVFLAFLIKDVRIKPYNLKNVISLYPVQIKKLPSLYSIASNIIYIHSLPPAAILYLIENSNNYFTRNYSRI